LLSSKDQINREIGALSVYFYELFFKAAKRGLDLALVNRRSTAFDLPLTALINNIQDLSAAPFVHVHPKTST